jgi:hypothetical protein
MERERSGGGGEGGKVSEDDEGIKTQVVTERVRAVTGIGGQESAHAAFVRVLKGPDTEVFV